jgi:predicted porin
VFFGIWPGIQNNNQTGGTNGTGGTQALGTPGIDFRQQFATLGKPHFGTLKIGRDLGFFGQEAILNDMTLLGAGSAGIGGLGATFTNTHPGSVTLGRIGVGYLYTDFMPQISYTTPSAHGLQAAFGIFQAYDSNFNDNGNINNGVPTTGTLDAHGQPMFQGKLSYTAGHKGVKAKFWSNFVTQSEQANLGGFTVNGTKVLGTGQSVRATGVDYGTSLTFHGANLTAYGYNGWGLGTTGLLFGGVDANFDAAGNGILKTRPSQGYYAQGTYTFRKATIGASYGQSVLSKGDQFDFALPVRVNSSYVGQFRYAVTKWDNLVAEYTHTRSEAQGQNFNLATGVADSTGPISTDDSVALGTIVFF